MYIFYLRQGLVILLFNLRRTLFMKFESNDWTRVTSSLTQALYTQKSVGDVALNFAISLTQGAGVNSPFISKLSSEMRQSAKFRILLREQDPNVMEEVGTAIVLIMEKLFPNINFSIEGREKTLFSDLNKRISKMLEGKSPRIQDLLAFRLIILNKDDEQTNIMRCYDILNSLLALFSLLDTTVETGLSWDISVKEVSPLKDHRASVSQKFPNLYLPEISGINPQFQKLVKDYIFFPNPQGYQSLHFVLTYKGFPLEIQIRNVDMHHWAEYGPAKHSEYKKNRTFQGITLEMFDEDLILCPKYDIFKNEQLITYPGLVNAVPFFRYSK